MGPFILQVKLKGNSKPDPVRLTIEKYKVSKLSSFHMWNYIALRKKQETKLRHSFNLLHFAGYLGNVTFDTSKVSMKLFNYSIALLLETVQHTRVLGISLPI